MFIYLVAIYLSPLSGQQTTEPGVTQQCPTDTPPIHYSLSVISLTRRYGRLCHYTQQSPVWTRLCSVVTLPVTRCQPSDSQGSVARPYPCEDAITGNVCKNKCVTSLFLYNLASCFQFNYSKQTVYTILTLIIYSSWHLRHVSMFSVIRDFLWHDHWRCQEPWMMWCVVHWQGCRQKVLWSMILRWFHNGCIQFYYEKQE